ncbi:[LSU ribosomal protein L3P]-glutamine N5-methyltransferase [Marinicella litoralis]|uniref:[LSU ribosomal protein L3P]-glutamine N5-methyltransferase n=1 Tax=Marinicella litoralis TaxID=644220 RepID=A0A4R6XVC0_9GAMM|nr:[LSU ribosomal protein L3P]-glutamine N5-methyltransferase [Marinicella litoralis]
MFYGHGVEQAEDEMLLLLMHVLNLDFETLNQMVDQHVNDSDIQKVHKILKQRVAQKMPMAYLVGFSVFAGLKFNIDKRALIPRSPFVELIDMGFRPWVDLANTDRVLDLCTGSGCIGLAIAHYFPTVRVDLADLSVDALALAAENMGVLKLEQRARCIHSDLFSELYGPYDLIVSNPPYVADDEYNVLPAEFSHEPKMALVSQHQGMEIPIKILYQAADYLTEDGHLFLEVGYNDAVLSRVLPLVEFEWIEFSVGGQGICVFNRADLLKYRMKFKEFLDHHVA